MHDDRKEDLNEYFTHSVLETKLTMEKYTVDNKDIHGLIPDKILISQQQCLAIFDGNRLPYN